MHRIETIKKSAQQQQQMKINDQWNNNKWIREQIVEAAAAAVSNKKAHTCIEHLYVVAFPSPKLKKWKKKIIHTKWVCLCTNINVCLPLHTDEPIKQINEFYVQFIFIHIYTKNCNVRLFAMILRHRSFGCCCFCCFSWYCVFCSFIVYRIFLKHTFFRYSACLLLFLVSLVSFFIFFSTLKKCRLMYDSILLLFFFFCSVVAMKLTPIQNICLSSESPFTSVSHCYSWCFFFSSFENWTNWIEVFKESL